MIRRLFTGFLAAIIMALLAVLVNAAGAGAVGPPSDNTTGLALPTDNQTSNEIKPLVNYVLRGPTAQSSKTEPSVVAAVKGSSGQPQSAFTAGDTWFLDMDINVPGWIYIYEYYPQGSASMGNWIAYKWRMENSGQWRFGPFSPVNGGLDGRHSYRIWFYSDGKWAAEKAGQSIMVEWTYTGAQPAPIAPPATTPVKEDSTLDRILPMLMIFIPLLLLIAILVSLVIYRRRLARRAEPEILLLPGEVAEQVPEPEIPEAKVEAPVNAPRAKLSMPNGAEIRFAGNKSIGRGELSRALEIDKLGLISRKHFEIKFKDDRYFVEDPGSANGTRLNGEDIGGRGPVVLNDDDVIEPAAAIKIKFIIM